MKPAAFPALRATRLLDQVRERIRQNHYSLNGTYFGPIALRPLGLLSAIRSDPNSADPDAIAAHQAASNSA